MFLKFVTVPSHRQQAAGSSRSSRLIITDNLSASMLYRAYSYRSNAWIQFSSNLSQRCIPSLLACLVGEMHSLPYPTPTPSLVLPSGIRQVLAWWLVSHPWGLFRWFVRVGGARDTYHHDDDTVIRTTAWPWLCILDGLYPNEWAVNPLPHILSWWRHLKSHGCVTTPSFIHSWIYICLSYNK